MKNRSSTSACTVTADTEREAHAWNVQRIHTIKIYITSSIPSSGRARFVVRAWDPVPGTNPGFLNFLSIIYCIEYRCTSVYVFESDRGYEPRLTALRVPCRSLSRRSVARVALNNLAICRACAGSTSFLA